MNTALFISKKIFTKEKSSFSYIVSNVAVASIVLGIIILIVSFSVLNGFNSSIKEKIFGFSGHLQITKFGANNSFEEIPISTNTTIFQNAGQIKEIKSISVYAKKPALINSEEGVQGVILKGIDKKYDKSSFEKLLQTGRFLEFKDSIVSKEILISKRISDKMRIKLGDDVLFYFVQYPPRYRKLKVVGIYNSGLEEFDDQMVLGDIRVIQKLNDWEDTLVGGYEINIADFNKLDEYAKVVYDEMDYNLTLIKISDMFYQLFDWFMLLETNINMLLIIIIVVVCVNLLSSFTIIILEKTSIIGTLKALGATNQLIQRIFLLNGIKMLFKGLIYGNSIGLILCYIQQKFKIIPLNEENYYMSFVPIKIDVEPIVFVNLIIIVFVLLALIIPTFFISTIKPIKSIKFD